MFWTNPDLVEILLPFLDPPSLLELARVHPLTRGIMQGNIIWGKFVRQNCPHPDWVRTLPLSHQEYNELSEECMAGIGPIIEILQTIGNPTSHLLKLLEFICESFPALERRYLIHDHRWGNIKVSCPTHGDHVVSLLGFQLLELVEGATGSSELKIGSVRLSFLEAGPLIQALISRAMRQEEI